MDLQTRLRGAAAMAIAFPAIGWLTVAFTQYRLPEPLWWSFMWLVHDTPEQPPLVIAMMLGLAVAAMPICWLLMANNTTFSGAPFKKFLRGAKVLSAHQLAALTRTKHEHRQIRFGTAFMPPDAETQHGLVVGTTGAGKSVLLRDVVWSAMKRGDRLVIVDPNGEMLAKFGRPTDKVLNPYDARGVGWSIFNEIRADYDWVRYARSVIAIGLTPHDETWHEYARTLLRCTGEKLARIGSPTVHELFRLCTLVPPEELQEFLVGTDAEAMFVGDAEKALGSARFVVGHYLAPHLKVPPGPFSIRDWLADETAGNLFITWRADMAPALRPLISAWVDVLCTSMLSTTPDLRRRLWLVIDELAALEKLASYEAALSMGRKHGLCSFAGIHTMSQFVALYGRDGAATLRANFGTLVALRCAHSDPHTAEEMAAALGKHEVERAKVTTNKTGRSRTTERSLESVVLASELQALPDLAGYVAFSKKPVGRLELRPVNFLEKSPGFIERTP